MSSINSDKREILKINGLGESIIEFNNSDNSEDVMSTIEKSYPKLSNIGGYEFLRVERGKHQLVLIKPTENGFDALSLGILCLKYAVPVLL